MTDILLSSKLRESRVSEATLRTDCANKEVIPRAFTAEVRPAPQPHAQLVPGYRALRTHPCPGRPMRLRPSVPAQLPHPRNPEGGQRLRGSRRGRDATARRHSKPDSRMNQSEEVALDRRPASRPHWGRGRCYLPWTCPLPAGAALLATAAATRRPEPKGLVTAPRVHRARGHAGVDVDRPRSPPPAGSSPPNCRHSALYLPFRSYMNA
ncbi:uncharacterized protein LOC126070060 [Elephas maximus indicus]|uniref:uncharacterized protein LOC126070060 n=1 Tax=Elephas maximus indicus TaxID=99487 RepID=UPI0021170D0C|nr:uncharacterized protein LOC126070060 [Elephas maximus indicus]